MRRGQSFLLCLLVGACQGAEGMPPEQDAAAHAGSHAARTIGPEGGRVTAGPVSLDIPAGALASATSVRLVPLGPGDLGAPLPETLLGLGAVRAEPTDLKLLHPARLSFASTEGDLQGVAVARGAVFATQPFVWQPLPGQHSSPGLLWAQALRLGVFGLLPVTCCAGPSDGGVCALRCDAGPLRYACRGLLEQRECCDPFVGTPTLGDAPACLP